MSELQELRARLAQIELVLIPRWKREEARNMEIYAETEAENERLRLELDTALELLHGLGYRVEKGELKPRFEPLMETDPEILAEYAQAWAARS